MSTVKRISFTLHELKLLRQALVIASDALMQEGLGDPVVLDVVADLYVKLGGQR